MVGVSILAFLYILYVSVITNHVFQMTQRKRDTQAFVRHHSRISLSSKRFERFEKEWYLMPRLTQSGLRSDNTWQTFKTSWHNTLLCSYMACCKGLDRCSMFGACKCPAISVKRFKCIFTILNGISVVKTYGNCTKVDQASKHDRNQIICRCVHFHCHLCFALQDWKRIPLKPVNYHHSARWPNGCAL